MAGRFQEVRPRYEAPQPRVEAEPAPPRLPPALRGARPGDRPARGDRRLPLPDAGGLALTVTGELPANGKRKGGATTLVATVLRDGKALAGASFPLRRGVALEGVTPGVLLGVSPGTVTLRWSGQGIQAGSREGIEVGAEEIVEVEIPVREDDRGKYVPPVVVASRPPGPPR